MTGRPNVLFLVVDSLRYDAVADDNAAATQTLDALAAEGVAFKACYSQGISTAPSMTAMLTGRYPLDYGGHWYVHGEQPTMAEQFAANGYRTAAIHSNPNVSRLRNFDKGFDTFEENILPLSSGPLVDTLPDRLLRSLNKAARICSRTPYLPADSVNAQMLDWVEGTDEPWFLWTQYMDTHGPYLPGDDFSFRNKLRAERLWRKAAVESPDEITDGEHDELRRNYQLEVEYFDAALGRFLDDLEAGGHLAETIVVVVGDHGDEFAEHGQYGHGNLPYEELVHVPLLVRFPDEMGLETPGQVETPVRTMDVLPTVLDAVEAELTESMADRIEGESLLPVLQGADPSYDLIHTEKEMRGDDALRFGFRTEDWTYLYDGKTDEDLLYDRQEDAEEVTDVSASEPDTVERFRGHLQVRLERIDATSEGIETPPIEDAPGVQERLEALGYKE
jgi:arylsulfatase A-like enzyme